MKFYFNCNNRTQANALKECGVKNILISYQYMRKQIRDKKKDFDSVMLISGKIDNVDDYYAYIKLWSDEFDVAVQYDVPMNMDITVKYWEKASDIVAPVLTVNYLQHLSRLNLHEDRTVVLGKMGGNIEEDEQLRKLPTQYNYHGLAKGRWIKSNIKSVNSSTWISGARNRKTDVWNSHSVEFGDKGRGDVSTLRYALEKYKDHLEGVGVRPEHVIRGDYDSLLKAPIALYYKPMFSELGISSENFYSL